MRVHFLIAFLFVSGCDYFAPPYVKEADQRAVAAYSSISTIAAKAELGQLSKPSSYKAEVDTYAKIISELETAKFALGAVNPAANKPAAEAQKSLLAQVDRCIQQVKDFAALNKSDGVAPQTGAAALLRGTCDLALRAVQARK